MEEMTGMAGVPEIQKGMRGEWMKWMGRETQTEKGTKKQLKKQQNERERERERYIYIYIERDGDER